MPQLKSVLRDLHVYTCKAGGFTRGSNCKYSGRPIHAEDHTIERARRRLINVSTFGIKSSPCRWVRRATINSVEEMSTEIHLWIQLKAHRILQCLELDTRGNKKYM